MFAMWPMGARREECCEGAERLRSGRRIVRGFERRWWKKRGETTPADRDGLEGSQEEPAAKSFKKREREKKRITARRTRSTGGLNAEFSAVGEEDLDAGGDGPGGDSDGAEAGEAGVVGLAGGGAVDHADGVGGGIRRGVVEVADLGPVWVGRRSEKRARNSARVSTEVGMV